MFDKIVVVTRKTRLEDLVARFNSRAQAKFYIEHAGGDFTEYEREDGTYHRSLDELRKSLDLGLKLQVIDRSFVPTFLFTPKDVVVAVGQDGLVANTAKYLEGQPLLGVNPDPERFDGILLPFQPTKAKQAVLLTLEEKAKVREVTLAEARLNDGQKLLAFNDLFVGAKTHVSARYKIQIDRKSESQSSSGVLISTGAGSTGWLSSVFNMAGGIAQLTKGRTGQAVHMGWEDPRLVYVVREPFASRHSQTSLIAGILASGHELVIESQMPSGGVIFSDGVEQDFLEFNSGAIARIKTSARKARLVWEEAA